MKQQEHSKHETKVTEKNSVKHTVKEDGKPVRDNSKLTPSANPQAEKLGKDETMPAKQPHTAKKLAETETGVIQGSDTEKIALSNTIEMDHPATHEKHVVVPDAERLTPGETLKTDVQNESTVPAVATNVLKSENNHEEVVTERGEERDRNYGGHSEKDADAKNHEAFVKAVTGSHPQVEEQIKVNESMGEKILKFVQKAKGDTVRLNDFIKSLYGAQKGNEPVTYNLQGTSKQIKGILSQLVADGKLSFADENYMNLGKGYYADQDQRLNHQNLDTIEIVAKK